MTQEKFDELVEECIKKDSMKDAWYLYFNNEEFNPSKIVDFFIEKKNSYYIAELISINSGNIDLDNLIDKIIATNDINLIGEIELNNLLTNLLSYNHHEKLRKAAEKLKNIV